MFPKLRYVVTYHLFLMGFTDISGVLIPLGLTPFPAGLSHNVGRGLFKDPIDPFQSSRGSVRPPGICALLDFSPSLLRPVILIFRPPSFI